MNRKILNIINTTAGRLIFALLSGLGYFMLVSGPIIEMSRGMTILLFFFAPLIVCGAALVLVKLIKGAQEEENDGKILRIVYLHISVILMGIVFSVAMFK